MLKVADNPPMRFPEEVPLSEFRGRWWVAHTKSRAEKALAWDLVGMQIGYFLPMVTRSRLYRGRKRKALLPLFPSYLFFCGSEEDRYRTMTTGHVCRTLDVDHQENLVFQLGQLNTAIVEGTGLDPYPFAVVGRRCRVRSGAFKGLEGTVIQRDRTCRFVLEVSVLGQGAALEIDADFLEPC